jgi:hypothetical protein
VFDDVARHVCEFETHLFIPDHWGIQIEVLYVHREESCSRCGYDAVDEELTVSRSAVGVPASNG